MERREALEIFGLQKNVSEEEFVSEEELEKIYKTLVKKRHPDNQPDNPNATADFQRLGEAYEILKTPGPNMFNLKEESEEEKENKIKNEKAYDEYVEIYNSCTTKANKLGVALDEKYFAYANVANRGIISETVYQKLKETIVADFQVLEKNVQAYDSFVNYLKAGDIKDPLYSSMSEKLKGKRGILSASEINKERMAFVNEFNANYQDKLTDENAFATFQKFYKEMQEDLRIHYGETIKPRENLNVESKEYSPEVYQELIDDLKECKKYFEAQKEWRFSIFKEKLGKRNIDVNFYLSLRKFENGDSLTYDTLTIPKLNEMLKAFTTMDQIESLLSSLHISLEEYLKKFGKTIETVTNKELEIILEEVQKLGRKVTITQGIFDAQDMMRR